MDIYVYRATVTAQQPLPDLTGWNVESVDGDRIGKVDDATYEQNGDAQGTGCLVVDTGFWIFGKKRLIPAGVVQSLDPDGERIVVSMTKDEVKGAPDYDADRHESDPASYHDTERSYYENFGGDRA